MPLLFVVGYYLLYIYFPTQHGFAPLLTLVRLLAFGCLYLAFGYAINDYSDMEVDRNVGKPNWMIRLSPSMRLLFLCSLFVLGIGLVPIEGELLQLALVVTSYLFAIFYSLPPVRFKERDVWGLLVSATAQRTFPSLVFFNTFTHWSLDALLICVLYSLIGLRWIIIHQILDADNDRRSGVRTFAAISGPNRLRQFLIILFPVEIVTLVLTLLSFAAALPWILVACVPYLLWLILVSFIRRRANQSMTLFSFEWVPLADFYFVYWPLVMAIGLITILQSIGIIILTFTVIWQRRYIRDEFKKVLLVLQRPIS